MRRAIPIVAIALVMSACAVNTQKTAIRDARLGLAISGVAVEAADQAAVEVFEEYDAEDTEKYCQGEIVTLVLEEAVSALTLGADAVRLWETSLAVYLAKKDEGTDTETDWEAVLSSEAAWVEVATQVIAVLTVVIRELEHAGIEIPAPINYATDWLQGMTGRPLVEDEVDWSDLADGVCGEYIGGGS
jgi:hypothetical protein